MEKKKNWITKTILDNHERYAYEVGGIVWAVRAGKDIEKIIERKLNKNREAITRFTFDVLRILSQSDETNYSIPDEMMCTYDELSEDEQKTISRIGDEIIAVVQKIVKEDEE